ncbi:hypothetical protein AGMMS49545_17400 [Betaproteobacteria bacterium]|nr:hypothetical protein AGMMS49545_17400 [Betaproteobacteria bacterium]GHU46677.1 hypothetical protein AGMMS50289_20610 [Betaproteobacteria bacterium]
MGEVAVCAKRTAKNKGNAMNAKTVTYEIDLKNPPPLTAAQKAELKALAAMPDAQVDTSDIPPLNEKFWENAAHGRFLKSGLFRPMKKSTTVRIDADVLEWLKNQGKGYQTRVNTILRNAMLQALHP